MTSFIQPGPDYWGPARHQPLALFINQTLHLASGETEGKEMQTGPQNSAFCIQIGDFFQSRVWQEQAGVCW